MILNPVRVYRPFLGGPTGKTIVPPPSIPFIINLETYLSSKLKFNNVSIPVWHRKLPQKLVTPGIYFQVVDGESLLNFSGASGGAWKHIRFTAVSYNPSDVWYYSEALRLILISRAGGPWPGMMGTSFVQGVTRHNESSDYTTAVDGSDKGPHEMSTEYYIYYAEPLS